MLWWRHELSKRFIIAMLQVWHELGVCIYYMHIARHLRHGRADVDSHRGGRRRLACDEGTLVERVLERAAGEFRQKLRGFMRPSAP